MPKSKQQQAKMNPKDRFRTAFKSIPAPEGGIPRLGVAVSKLTSDQLGDMISRYSAWREYCEDMHLIALADFMAAKEVYDMAVAKEVVASGDDVTVTEKKAAAQTSNKVAPLRKDFVHKEMYFKMLASKLESFSNSLAMLSRELTRRGIINI